MPENRADVFHVGGPSDQGAPCWRHAGATNATTIAWYPHAEANNVSPDAGRMAGYRTGRDPVSRNAGHRRRVRMFWFQSPAFHFASGQISGTSLPLCVQGSTVHSSLVLRSLITAVLCGPSVNR